MTVLPPLEHNCPECDGKGKVEKDGATFLCSYCFGRGIVLTEEGKKILNLVTRYIGSGLVSVGRCF